MDGWMGGWMDGWVDGWTDTNQSGHMTGSHTVHERCELRNVCSVDALDLLK